MLDDELPSRNLHGVECGSEIREPETIAMSRIEVVPANDAVRMFDANTADPPGATRCAALAGPDEKGAVRRQAALKFRQIDRPVVERCEDLLIDHDLRQEKIGLACFTLNVRYQGYRLWRRGRIVGIECRCRATQ